MKADARYTRTAITLHWLVAALMVVNVGLGLYGQVAPDDWVRPVIDAHKSIGITVLGLAVLRLSWRLSHPAPALPASYPRWERFSAHAAHGLLYVLIFALPLSGWAHDSAWKGAASHPIWLYGLIPFPRIGFIESLPPEMKERWHDGLFLLHQSLGYALYVLVALHIAGALKHQFLDREPELQRMGL